MFNIKYMDKQSEKFLHTALAVVIGMLLAILFG